MIDLNNAKVDSKTYDTNILFPALTSVSRDGQTYTIGINEKASTRYAGVGTPDGSNYDEVLETALMRQQIPAQSPVTEKPAKCWI